MKLILLVFSLTIAGVFTKNARSLQGALLAQKFEDFMSTFNKEYSSPEEQALRLQVFAKNFDEIERLNLEAEKNGESARFEVNEFADLTTEEFTSMYTGLIPESSSQVEAIAANNSDPIHIMRQTPPSARNWVQENKIGAIKNQRQCGSCWAFATLSVVEAVITILHGSGYRLPLSEQQLVDCDTGNGGCNGGWYTNAFKYALSGTMLDRDYPYVARRETCKFSASKVYVKGGSVVTFQSEEAIRTYVGTKGPVAIAMYASTISSYASGIIEYNRCGTNTVNHAVVVVGYGNENGIDFWLIRNSWGNRWGVSAVPNGERGYMKMRRNQNVCGIVQYQSFALNI